MKVVQTQYFSKWLKGLRDRRAKAIIAERIRRLELGHLGDVKSVGQGVSELRHAYGPGYRIYFTRKGQKIIILLAGGTKGSQSRDIKRAKEMVTLL
ncbi:type II toxin-antitoxin system RelE/ParE family toxin [Litorimonas sp.]|uniref:type II toxin-antitoxin system RelE/ParE family toxin n=1 Tax=Litorimonas sp. TaxID=1892381 RepID=UPI003A89676C